MSTTAWARLGLLGAALAFSTGGAAIKAVALPGLEVAGLRSLIAGVVMLLAVPATRRGWSRRVGVVSLAHALTLMLFVVANKLTTAANSIFLQSTFPLWVVLASPWLLGEQRRRDDVGVLVVMLAGTALFAFSQDAPSAIATDPVLGNAVALASGAAWGATILGLRWLARDGGGASAAAALGNLVAAGLALALAWPWQVPTATDWAVVVWLGVVQVGLAYVLLSWAMQHVDALEASILLMAEPACSPVWAWLVHGERPAPLALVGGAVILGGLVLRALLEARTRAARRAAARTPRIG
ncbi:MAG: DMT family transporter [Alphaproteobacteria bacterium]|nr:DMT family transporter [Alphaproteobacteria bacterium]